MKCRHCGTPLTHTFLDLGCAPPSNAYLHAADRLRSRGGVVRRVVLDYELKRDYQRFLRDLNRERRRAERDASAPQRTPESDRIPSLPS